MRLCGLGKILEILPEEHRKAVIAALDHLRKDGGLSDAALAYEITQAGFSIAHNLVNLHRREKCICEWSQK
jgi:hypothetical protein